MQIVSIGVDGLPIAQGRINNGSVFALWLMPLRRPSLIIVISVLGLYFSLSQVYLSNDVIGRLTDHLVETVVVDDEPSLGEALSQRPILVHLARVGHKVFHFGILGGECLWLVLCEVALLEWCELFAFSLHSGSILLHASLECFIELLSVGSNVVSLIEGLGVHG
jgi:hypothetical protein